MLNPNNVQVVSGTVTSKGVQLNEAATVASFSISVYSGKDKNTGEYIKHYEFCKAFSFTIKSLDALKVRSGSAITVIGTPKNEEWTRGGDKQKSRILFVDQVTLAARPFNSDVDEQAPASQPASVMQEPAQNVFARPVNVNTNDPVESEIPPIPAGMDHDIPGIENNYFAQQQTSGDIQF